MSKKKSLVCTISILLKKKKTMTRSFNSRTRSKLTDIAVLVAARAVVPLAVGAVALVACIYAVLVTDKIVGLTLHPEFVIVRRAVRPGPAITGAEGTNPGASRGIAETANNSKDKKLLFV